MTKEKEQLYKRFKLNPKKAKPGDLMKAAAKRKAEGKGFPAMHKKHKSVERESMPVSLNANRMNMGGPNGMKLGNQSAEFTKAKHMKTHCKMCGKVHEKGKHEKKHEKHEKKHEKHEKKHEKRKEHSAEAIKGMKDFVKEESKEKSHKKRKSHKKNWIAGAIKHPGALHRELGVKEGHKIPASKLRHAAKEGGKIGRRARLAETLKGFHHKK